MEVLLGFGNIVIQINIDRPIVIDSILMPFQLSKSERVDVTVDFTWRWNSVCSPSTECIGSDSLLEYYTHEEGRCVFTVASGGKYQAYTEYTESFDYMRCQINEKICPPEKMNLGTMLRFLPLRAVFHHFDVLFFHAAQISCSGKGILFTAPSGTGKTTQAKLWRDSRGAEMLCNDRTLIRKREGIWKTYGYPLDGSEPVRSTQVTPLGCIVLLQQGKENKVERLKGGKALSGLMSQLVMDAWDGDARVHAIELLADMMQEIPVYLLSCTPDQDAVDCLEKKLLEEGVLSDGEY